MQVTCQLQSSHSPNGASIALLAPPWHTRLLIALLLAVPLAGLILGTSRPPASRVTGQYLPSVLVSVGLASYVVRLGLGRSILPELLGTAWHTRARALADVLAALGFAGLLLALDTLLVTSLSLPESVHSHAWLPTTSAERLAWLLVALTAGTTEELVYRGYLQAQLGALLGSRALGLLLQALLFAIAHAEQGGAASARFALYALGFGLLAQRRASLLPGMVAHVVLDLYAGLAI